MTILKALLSKLPQPTADQLINQSNREMHKFHLGKYRNFKAASVHRDRAIELQRMAEALRKKQG